MMLLFVSLRCEQAFRGKPPEVFPGIAWSLSSNREHSLRVEKLEPIRSYEAEE
jgi:hypothetical protein